MDGSGKWRTGDGFAAGVCWADVGATTVSIGLKMQEITYL